jgi:hypothetical protein
MIANNENGWGKRYQKVFLDDKGKKFVCCESEEVLHKN